MIFSAMIGLAILSSCDTKAKEENKEATMTTESKGVNVKLADLATTKDFYCGMDLEEGSIADTASYNGKTYGFCSDECKEGFMADPEKYLSQQ